MTSKREILNRFWRLNKVFYENLKAKRHRYLNEQESYFEHLPENIYNKAECYFVLTTGRTGTLLLTNAFELSNSLDVHHVPFPELAHANNYFYQKGQIEFDAYCKVAQFTRYELIQEAYFKNKAFVETNCKITFLAPHIKNVFKRARFIHLVRNPVSFAKSAIARGYYQNAKSDLGHIIPYKEQDLKKWNDYSLYEKAAWNWEVTNQFIENFKADLSKNDIITIKSEDLYKDVNVVQGLFDFMGKECPNEATLKKTISNKFNKSNPRSAFSEDHKAAILNVAMSHEFYGY